METDEIIRRNKAIAIWLGWRIVVTHYLREDEFDQKECWSVYTKIPGTPWWDSGNFIYTLDKVAETEAQKWRSLLHADFGRAGTFHQKWESIMPVVEQIHQAEDVDDIHITSRKRAATYHECLIVLTEKNIQQAFGWGKPYNSLLEAVWMSVSDYCLAKQDLLTKPLTIMREHEPTTDSVAQ